MDGSKIGDCSPTALLTVAESYQGENQQGCEELDPEFSQNESKGEIDCHGHRDGHPKSALQAEPGHGVPPRWTRQAGGDGRLDGWLTPHSSKTSAPFRSMRLVNSSIRQASVMGMSLFSPWNPFGGLKRRDELVLLRSSLIRCRAILSKRLRPVGWPVLKNLLRNQLGF